MGKRPVKPGMAAKILTIVFGAFLCLILLELGLRLAGSVFLSSQERRNKASIHQKGTYRILCLGESTTAIGGVYSYPSQLQEILNRRADGVKFSVINKGLPGINTSDILARLEANLDEYRPDMVITMMGNNDRGTNMFYEVVPESKIRNFFRSLSVYKLTRIILAHIVNRFKEPNSDEPGAIGEVSLKNDREYVNKGKFCRDLGKFPEAETLFRKAIKFDPNNDEAYLELGWVCRIQGKFPEAEAAFRKAVEINPQNYWPYVEQGKFSEAEALFKKNIALNPANDWLYIGLGWIYQDQGKFTEAEEEFRKAKEVNPRNKWLDVRIGPSFQAQESIKVNPGNDRSYIEIGQAYLSQGRLSKAEEVFRKAIDANPRDDRSYLRLGLIYRDQGKFPDAEAALKKAVEINPKNDKAYKALKVLYIERGDPQLGREYDNKAKELNADYYPRTAVDNYHKLKAVLDKRGIRYVCAQYPLRSIEPLRKIFQGSARGILFVDNEKLFKNALQKAGYKDYFIDLCNGDSGHCTPEGNRLLAENIANVILDEVFSAGRGVNTVQNREKL